jgi:hypothetical protein
MLKEVEEPRHGFVSNALALLVALPLIGVAGALVVIGANSVIRPGDADQTSKVLAFRVDPQTR